MEEIGYLTQIYDLYKELLTPKQKEYFEEYYFDNLSLAEISENYNVSRNAIYNHIKATTDKLNYYESKLKLLEKLNNLEEILKDIEDLKVKEKIEKIYMMGAE